LNEIRGCGFNLYQLVSTREKCLGFIPELEAEEAVGQECGLPMWGFSGVIEQS
jgi:hypothetical protein